MQNAIGVKKLETEDHTSDEKFSLFFTESPVFSNVIPQVTTLHEIDHEVEVVTVLERIVHVDQEWMVQLTEELFLVHH